MQHFDHLLCYACCLFALFLAGPSWHGNLSCTFLVFHFFCFPPFFLFQIVLFSLFRALIAAAVAAGSAALVGPLWQIIKTRTAAVTKGGSSNNYNSNNSNNNTWSTGEQQQLWCRPWLTLRSTGLAWNAHYALPCGWWVVGGGSCWGKASSCACILMVAIKISMHCYEELAKAKTDQGKRGGNNKELLKNFASSQRKIVSGLRCVYLTF